MIRVPAPRRRSRRRLVVAVVLALGALSTACAVEEEAPTRAAVSPGPTGSTGPTASPTSASTSLPARPLAGRVVVLDPGHQLGNGAFPDEINAPVEAGGRTKACNTTGTATDDGYAEATLNWQVARQVQRRLERRGARVRLTREVNGDDAWGPCVDERGRAGNPDQRGPTADVKVSIHADGSYAADARGFHVIAPEDRDPWTSDIARPSLRLARTVRDALVRRGLEPSTYTGTDGLDVRGDLGTLNLSDVPTVMVELGNMRHPDDAARMTTPRGRTTYARALATAIERYLIR